MESDKRALNIAVAGLLMVVAAPIARANTITVSWDGSGDYVTIQDGIDSALAGDEVVICPGTYTGDGNRDLVYNGKAITVRGTNPEDPDIVAATVIDCQGNAADPHRGFMFFFGETADSILAGLTITHGYAPVTNVVWHTGSNGGAVICFGSSPTIEKCILTNNWAEDTGGGLCCSQSNTKLVNCTLSGNVAHHEERRGSGGGMACLGSTCTLINCTFSGNTCDDRGAGLYSFYSNDMTMLDCTFNKNGPYSLEPPNGRFGWGPNSFSGGGIWIDHGAGITLENCTFQENSAALGGGMNTYHSYMKLTNCAFLGNTAKQGGGMWNNPVGALHLYNCIFVGNQAEYFGGGFCDVRSYSTMTNCTFSNNSAFIGGSIASVPRSSLTLDNCILWGNTASYGPELYNDFPSDLAVYYSNIQGGQSAQDIDHRGLTWGDELIDTDPLFVRSPNDGGDGWVDDPDTLDVDEAANNDYGDLRLLSGSPCIDAGNNDSVPQGINTDFEGSPRILDGDLDRISIVDMGAYELDLTISAELDILPGSDRNPFMPNKKRKGRLPMVIFGSEEIAADDIDPDSIKIAGLINPVKVSADKDIDGDGLVDLFLHFYRRDLVDAMSLDAYEVGAEVDVTVGAYRISDGRPIMAVDSIVIAGSGN